MFEMNHDHVGGRMRFRQMGSAAALAAVVASSSLVFAATSASAAPAPRANQVAAAKTCHITNISGETLNVRGGAGTKYSVVGTIAVRGKVPCGSLGEGSVRGQKYTACGATDSDWKTVRIGGRDGWVAAECVALSI
ncbi:SH3 domain-containing protein [Streptomyces sp. NPDC015171]|uniref:SH3 domain-containing protein n=1 Tax=Streptomyces sp. NPDC015171 TaxID=3364945 RepID=UPI0036FF6539